MGRVTRSSTKKSTTAEAASAAASEPPAKKATVTKKKIVKKPAAKKDTPKDAATATTASTSGNTVTIEACKQWGAFKTRATKIQKAVGTKASVVINAEKPGRGNFVVRVSGVDEPVVELLGMKRPFPDLKALVMEDVCENVLKALEEKDEEKKEEEKKEEDKKEEDKKDEEK